MTIFDQVVNETLFVVFARHSQINGNERESSTFRVQTVETFQCPAPDRTVPPFNQNVHVARVPVFILRHNYSEHWRCHGFFVRIEYASRRSALRVEVHKPATS